MNRKIIAVISLLICFLGILPFSFSAADNGNALGFISDAKINMLIVTTLATKPTFSNGSLSYFIGGVIAILLMGYLVYTLLKPEKF